MKFLDQAKIYIRSGNGGAGAVSFRREKFIEFGGPDGGDGGRGGDIIALCVDGLNTLIDYRYQQHFKAGTGVHGMGRNRAGGKGADVIMKVPVGTQVFEEDNETLIADLTTVGQRVVIARGGNGGFGNSTGGSAQSSTTVGPTRSGSYLFTNSRVSSSTPYTLSNTSAYSMSFWFQANSGYQVLTRVSPLSASQGYSGQGTGVLEYTPSGYIGLYQPNAVTGGSSYLRTNTTYASGSTPSCVTNLAASMNGTFVGPGADLQNVNFGSANLSNRDLS